MLYVPPPYSSGTHLSDSEKGKYTINTPPSPPTALLSSDLHHETSDCQRYLLNDTKDNFRESPPLTPKQLESGTSVTTKGDIKESSFFMKEQQAKPSDYVLYNNEYEDTTYYQEEYDHQPQQDATYLYEPFYSTTATSMTDDYFETANRAFHATINKFSRQNYPEHRKRSIYNFLENWHLHSMYSKSQQILLGMAHVRPMVLLSGDDFMFTPPLLQEQQPDDDDDDDYDDTDYQQQLGYLDQSMEMEWIDDDEQIFEENELDDNIVIMSAPDPPSLSTPALSPVLNENAWMKNHMNLISESSILHDDDYQPDHDTSPHFLGEITSELLHWYRTSERGRPPSTIMEKYTIDDEPTIEPAQSDKEQVADTSTATPSNPTPMSYQSLADIVHYSSPSAQASALKPYGHLVSQMTAASDLALAMASDYHSRQTHSAQSFIRCLFQIWQVFLLTTETVMTGLWGRKVSSPSVDSILPF